MSTPLYAFLVFAPLVPIVALVRELVRRAIPDGYYDPEIEPRHHQSPPWGWWLW